MSKFITLLAILLFAKGVAAEINNSEREFLDAVSTLENVGDASGSVRNYVFDLVDEQIRRNLVLSQCPSFVKYKGMGRIADRKYFNAVTTTIESLNRLANSKALLTSAISEHSAAWLAAYRRAHQELDTNLSTYAGTAAGLRHKTAMAPEMVAEFYANERIDINTGDGRPDSLHRLRALLTNIKVEADVMQAAKKLGFESQFSRFLTFTANDFDPATHNNSEHLRQDAFFVENWKAIASNLSANLDRVDVLKSMAFFASDVAMWFYSYGADAITDEINSEFLPLPRNLIIRPISYPRVLVLLSQRKMSEKLEQLVGQDLPPLARRLAIESMVKTIYRDAVKPICR